jgi:hypothetical protein
MNMKPVVQGRRATIVLLSNGKSEKPVWNAEGETLFYRILSANCTSWAMSVLERSKG